MMGVLLCLSSMHEYYWRRTVTAFLNGKLNAIIELNSLLLCGSRADPRNDKGGKKYDP
jgi:hypothetical protein